MQAQYTPSPLTATPGERGSALVAAILVMAILVVAAAVGVPRGISAMKATEAVRTRSVEKWEGRARVQTGLAFFKDRLRSSFETDLRNGRARLQGKVLPAFDNQPTTSRVNYALPANGAVASASSMTTYQGYPFLASKAVDGDRKGLNYLQGGIWQSGTATLPQWLQVDFQGYRSIDEINVFSLQNNYNAPAEPTETMTFTYYGLVSYVVQYWDGSAWVDVPGGTVSGNNKIWNKFTFTPISTTKIRVLISATGDGWSRVNEIEAWGEKRSGVSNAQTGTARPVIVPTAEGGSSYSGCESTPNGCTSIMGNIDTYLTSRRGLINASFFQDTQIPTGTVGIADIRVVEWRKMATGGEAAYRIEYVMDARGGKNGRTRDSGEVIFGVNDITCGTTIRTPATEQSVTRGASATITAEYTRATALVLSANGSVIERRVIEDNMNSQTATFTVTPSADTTYEIKAEGAGGCTATTTHTVRVLAPVCPTITSFDLSQRTNYASAANGGTATASSSYAAGYSPSGAINGDRRGANWENGGGWADGTVNSYPDWLQVDFNGTKAIDEINVFGVQDNYWNPSEPTTAMTWTNYGLPAFQVQYWNGASWADVPGGNVTGNNLIWRRFTFSPITTSRIRVVVNNALYGNSRITEVEAYGSQSSSSSSEMTIYGGGNVTLDWQVQTAATVYLNGSPVSASGSMTVNVTSDTTFTLEARDATNQCPQVLTRTVRVLPCPTVQLFDSQPMTLTRGTANVVRWNVVNPPPSTSTVPRANVALAANGGTATASSLYSDVGYSFSAAAAINGDRRGLPTSSNMWHDAAPGNSYPDWLQVDFNGTKVIDEVDVFSLQDAYASAGEPTPTQTFSLYGLRAFDVQYWNGTSWITVPGGSITGNNLVWRKVTFPPVSTTRIRILITAAGDGWSRVVELEAYGTPPANTGVFLDGVPVAASGTLPETLSATTTHNLRVISPSGCAQIDRYITVTVNNRPCPAITSFQPTLSTITEGDTLTFNWNVTDAPAATTQIRLTGGGLNELVAATGPRTLVMPTAGTYTFTLTVTSTLPECSTPQTRSFNVTVNPRPVPCDIGIDTFSPSESSMMRGGTVNINWMTHSNKAGTQVFLNGVAVAANGVQPVSPSVTTDYTLLIQNPGAGCTPASRTFRVTVTDRPCPSITNFAPNLTNVTEGDTISVGWDVANAPGASTSVRLTGPGVNSLAVASAGSRAFTLSTAGTYTFTLDVTSSLSECGTAQRRQFTVTVSPPSCNIGIDSMDVSSSCVAPGGMVTVTWTAHSNRSGTTVQINGAGSYPLSGSANFTVNAAQNFTLSVGTAECGTFTQTRSVAVSQTAPIISSFAPSNNSPYAGEAFDLTYAVTGAQTVQINGAAVNPSNGSLRVSVSAPTDFVLVATSGGCSPQTSTRTVRVTPRSCPVPAIAYFRANPPTAGVGSQTFLEWSIGNNEPGMSVSITGNGVNLTGLPATGSVAVNVPNAVGTYYYMITAANPCDPSRTVSQQAAVQVTCPAPQVTAFAINPTSFEVGTRATINLAWNIVDSSGTPVSVSIDRGVGGGLAQSGNLDAPAPTVAGTYVYTITATNACGAQISVQASVVVTPPSVGPRQTARATHNGTACGWEWQATGSSEPGVYQYHCLATGGPVELEYSLIGTNTLRVYRFTHTAFMVGPVPGAYQEYAGIRTSLGALEVVVNPDTNSPYRFIASVYDLNGNLLSQGGRNFDAGGSEYMDIPYNGGQISAYFFTNLPPPEPTEPNKSDSKVLEFSGFFF